MLLKELQLPKPQQKLSEDLFIEMERSLKTVMNRIPEYGERERDAFSPCRSFLGQHDAMNSPCLHLDEIRDVLVEKFRDGRIHAVTDFRQLSKIATAIDNLGLQRAAAVRSLDEVFDPSEAASIREAYERTVEFGYDEKHASSRLQSLTEFLDRILDANRVENLDDEFLARARQLYSRLAKILRS